MRIALAAPKREELASYLRDFGLAVEVLRDAGEVGRPFDVVILGAGRAGEAPSPPPRAHAPRRIWLGETGEAAEGDERLSESADDCAVLAAVLRGHDREGVRPENALLRGLSHALANPIAVLSGWLQVLESNPADPMAPSELRREFERMERLVLALAMIGGRRRPGEGPADLVGTVRERFARAEKAALSCEVFAPEGLPWVRGDARDHQLWVALLAEAFEEEAHQVGTLQIEMAETPRGLSLSFRPSGPLWTRALDVTDLNALLASRRRTLAFALSAAHSFVVNGLGGTAYWGEQDHAGLHLMVPAISPIAP